MSEHTSGRLYIRTNRHPNTDGTAWGWVDLYPPGSMNQAGPEGVQVTWSRGRKSEANARRVVACWNACEGIETDRLKDLGKPLIAHLIGCDERAARHVKERNDLLEALEIAMGHIDMASLEVSHCKDAELIRAAIKKARG